MTIMKQACKPQLQNLVITILAKVNSDLAYGAVKRILFYVLYIHCFEGTDNNKCHSYDV